MKLKDYYKLYPKQLDCLKLLEEIRWNNSPKCPYCESTYHSAFANENRYHCNTCNSSFSVTVQTIFHKTRCDLQKWFYAIFIYTNVDRNITARELAAEIDVTKDTAWRMLGQIRKSIVSGETWIYKLIKQPE